MSPPHPFWTRGDGPGAFTPFLTKNSLWWALERDCARLAQGNSASTLESS